MIFFQTIQLYFRDKPEVVNRIRRELDIRNKNEKSINGLIFSLKSYNHIISLSHQQKKHLSDELQPEFDNLTKNNFDEVSQARANKKFDEIASRFSRMARYVELDLKSISLLKKVCEKKHHLGIPCTDEERKITEMKNRISGLKDVSEAEIDFAKRFLKLSENKLENCTELNSLSGLLESLIGLYSMIAKLYKKNQKGLELLSEFYPFLDKNNYASSDITIENLDKVRNLIKNISDCYASLHMQSDEQSLGVAWVSFNTYFHELKNVLSQIKNSQNKIKLAKVS